MRAPAKGLPVLAFFAQVFLRSLLDIVGLADVDVITALLFIVDEIDDRVLEDELGIAGRLGKLLNGIGVEGDGSGDRRMWEFCHGKTFYSCLSSSKRQWRCWLMANFSWTN